MPAVLAAAAATALLSTVSPSSAPDSIFQFTDMVAINGSAISMESFKGHVTLVVNVASY